MKTVVVILLYLIFGQWQSSYSQVHDSVYVQNLHVNNFKAIGIRQIDSVDFANYKINSAYYGRYLRGDSLYIFVKSSVDCLPATTFVGEYTRADSIHFIDYLRCQELKPFVQIENVCGSFISRNQLPELKRLVANIEDVSMEIVSSEMYIQTDSAVLHFTLNNGIFSDEVRKCLMKMHEGQGIIFDNIRVMADKQLRTIQNPPGYVIKN